MSKSVEELYRETKEKAQRSASPKKSDDGVRYEKVAPPERWYEKHWGIWLALIICFPIGIILLCSSRKYSSGSKIGISLAMVCLIFFVHNSYSASEKPSSSRKNVSYTAQSTETAAKTIYASTQRSCFCIINLQDVEGFLDAAKRKDVAYIDAMLANGKAFVIKRNTRVLCSDSGAYEGIVFVTFLEGEHTGERAYTFKKRVQ